MSRAGWVLASISVALVILPATLVYRAARHLTTADLDPYGRVHGLFALIALGLGIPLCVLSALGVFAVGRWMLARLGIPVTRNHGGDFLTGAR